MARFPLAMRNYDRDKPVILVMKRAMASSGSVSVCSRGQSTGRISPTRKRGMMFTNRAPRLRVGLTRLVLQTKRRRYPSSLIEQHKALMPQQGGHFCEADVARRVVHPDDELGTLTHNISSGPRFEDQHPCARLAI